MLYLMNYRLFKKCIHWLHFTEIVNITISYMNSVSIDYTFNKMKKYLLNIDLWSLPPSTSIVKNESVSIDYTFWLKVYPLITFKVYPLITLFLKSVSIDYITLRLTPSYTRDNNSLIDLDLRSLLIRSKLEKKKYTFSVKKKNYHIYNKKHLYSLLTSINLCLFNKINLFHSFNIYTCVILDGDYPWFHTI